MNKKVFKRIRRFCLSTIIIFLSSCSYFFQAEPDTAYPVGASNLAYLVFSSPESARKNNRKSYGRFPQRADRRRGGSDSRHVGQRGGIAGHKAGAYSGDVDFHTFRKI